MNQPNKYYIGDTSVEFKTYGAEKLKQRIKNLLLLSNVNVLIGNGVSLSLGAPSISNIASIIGECAKISNKDSIENFADGISALKKLTAPEKFSLDVETFLNILIQAKHIAENKSFKSDKVLIGDNEYQREHINATINIVKSYLYINCKKFLEAIDSKSNKLRAHKEFLRRVLLRPTTLSRVKLFTINYDLGLERCMDELGIAYFDGFIGGYQKRLRPESYNYDLYYPGETTEGKVNRVDRVLQLYKIHGSINWTRVLESADNIFGVKQGFPKEDEIGETLMIYPSTLKYGETLGYPYSEMFRNFSSALFKPQTVLFSFGYSFRDEHINRLIYQALSIPTFNLVIVIPEGEDNPEIKRLITKVGSKRIIVIAGGIECEKCNMLKGIGTFCGFVKDVMPDMEEMRTQEKIADELKRLYNYPKVNSVVDIEVSPLAEVVPCVENSAEDWCCNCSKK